MLKVDYEHAFPYRDDLTGHLYPRLALRLTNPVGPAGAEDSIDVDAYLDSGAERSLFDGHLASVIGIELLAGPEKLFQSTHGAKMEARLHQVRLSHPELGAFDLEVGFSTAQVARNLLGRDFFRRVQIGFRESHGTFYLTAHP